MIFKLFLDILFPPLCHHCRAFIPAAGPVHLCPACRAACISPVTPICTVCGVPFLTEGGADHPCGSCALKPPPFIAARTAMLFDGPVREMIHRFKYDKRVHLARPLGLLAAVQLAPFARMTAPDLIIPVPLHVKRLRQRGFNQSVLLGNVLAHEWRVPLCRRNLCRIRWTDPQIGLSAEERVSNVRGAFAVTNPALVKGKRVLLLDDVYTTGSTVAECARALNKAGARAVTVVTVARALS